MLELPEVLTLSKQANNMLSGKTITQVFNATKPHKFTFYNGNPKEYGKLLVGKTILSSEGYGMFVDFSLSDNALINIGDGVIARYYNPDDKIPANYQLLLTFDDGSFLAFSVAMYGFINAYPDRNIDNKYYKLSRESISPISNDYGEEEFEKLFVEAKKTLSAKALLATEQRIPGVGNGVTQDILFNARINPKQKISILSDRKKEVLFKSLKDTLIDMTIEGGRDTQTDLYGNNGGYRTIMSAKTWKNPCPRCGGTIVKEAYLGGSVYYCPECQRIEE
ncbi:DNA-formamidopyrimidine glycosylase [Proteiniphilum saccharofermentans]|uniref:DNA-formamidopyrimidine glycosylase n=1 Tax=Proteiniphilum saccharofermentans TaxID=1642647 RepID=A0A1R3T0L8_9BACT|nr:DNA-formamidopyrimidine glycosylase family protein [Proteiniphilum saccharofermentans]SCD19612.1 DNA-formamidopyrimidine glycosylase [Proteiniphilum saccharofermentans]SEA00018.1 formamidopyrimidine-DNA glycosylase [Porphyromonadaceae bacterium KH3R12]